MELEELELLASIECKAGEGRACEAREWLRRLRMSDCREWYHEGTN